MKPEISAPTSRPATETGAGPENATTPPAKRGEAAENSPDGKSPELSGPEIAARLHATYVRWSGIALTLREGHGALWWTLYVDRGRDLAKLEEDLRVVCIYLREQIGRDKRNPGALRLVNLAQPDQFDADVAEARMMLGKRAQKVPGATKPEPAKAPPGWRAWLEDQYPQFAPDYRDKPFDDLPGQLQTACRAGLQ